MTNIDDLEVLKKYLSDDELKDIAKQVAFESFRRYLGNDNPNAKENYEYYAKYGALQSIIEYSKDFDNEELGRE